MSPKSTSSNTAVETASQLIAAINVLREHVFALEKTWEGSAAKVHPHRRVSALNLVHDLALRQIDIRELQPQLASLGLSRLGRSEAHTVSSLNAVLTALYALAGRANPGFSPGPVTISEGSALLAKNAQELLGTTSSSRQARIMVTMPSEAASKPALLEDLLRAGMNVMRINCAHDGRDEWLAMITNLRAAERATGLNCRVYADLAGPKLRTGKLRAEGRKIEFKPTRDTWGKIVEPARIWVTPQDDPEPAPQAAQVTVPVTSGVMSEAQIGDSLALQDSRGAQQKIRLTEPRGRSWLAEGQRHVYLRDGAECVLRRGKEELGVGCVGPLPEVVSPLLLHLGDKLWLTPEGNLGGPARRDEHGELIEYASIPCTMDAVFQAAVQGQPIWFDDGKIGGVILAVGPSRILVEITHAPTRGARLRAAKGINLPETNLDVPSLSEKDLDDLKILAPHVDMVGLSFVRRAQDVVDLHKALANLGAERLGTVLKIETRWGFENLPHILIASLAHPPVGIMVARGDLAVEVGFERLAEVQEEILWLCEAAHVPVIWATQVLESMAKRGQPSRAEVCDAAFAVRSECVMLNKGPYIVETVRFLGGVLSRMSTLHAKGRMMMRKLAVSDVGSA
jgi:pyruvate kinase